MSDLDNEELQATKKLQDNIKDEKSELEEAMQTLLNYCNRTDCEKCMFVHITYECGIHNPSCWKGIDRENN